MSHIVIIAYLLSPVIPMTLAGIRDAKDRRLILWISIPVCWLVPGFGLLGMVLVASLNPKRNEKMENYLRQYNPQHSRR